MRLYLTRSSIPEMTGLSRPEQRRAWRYAARRIWFRPVPLGGFVLMIILYISLGHWGADTFRLFWALAIVCPIAGIVGLVYGSILAHCGRPYLREYLNSIHSSEQASSTD